MRKLLATLTIAVLGAIGVLGPTAAPAQPVPVAAISCVNVSTPGGTKCLQAGQYCSHKRGYAAAYAKAGFRCKANGRLDYL